MPKAFMKYAYNAIYLIAVCTLAACANGLTGLQDGALKRPNLDLPAAAVVAPLDVAVWWKSFKDPVLDALIQEAASHSQDIALAAGRVLEAQAALGQNTANLYPSVDLNLGGSRRQGSQNSATFNPAASPFSSDVQLGLSASYEIDFWGKFARADDAARARLLAQMAAQGTVLTGLYASVAQGYFALRALDAQALLAEHTLATRQEALRLQQRRFQAGMIGGLDLRQAQAEVASVEASLRSVRLGLANAETTLALLLGRSPAQITKPQIARGEDIAVLYAAPLAPADLPADLLARRPDLASAEQALMAAQADIAQARTAYFPRLALTASLGQQSQDLSNLFTPNSLFWSMLGNLTQPIFRAGAIDSVVAAANARQRQALAQYTQAVHNAFRDAQEALANVQAGRDMVAAAERRADALHDSLRLSEKRYQAGYSSYLDVLTAQRDLAVAQAGRVDAQRNQLAAMVSLYRALGGGWEGLGQRLAITR
jgi:outer membrane protein, multidrug efflux system